MSATLVTAAIKEALRARYCAPEWACFFEVPESTGGGPGRLADAVAMNMYPSRGLRVHGIEVKASRGDWLRELRDPSKSEPVQRFCDHWWIAANVEVVKPEELPPTWGLLELSGRGLRQKVAAPLLEAQPITRAFAASLFRSAAGRAARELNEQVRKATADEQAKVVERIRAGVDENSREAVRLRADIAAFEQASGIRISDSWRGGAAVGEAVRLVQDLGVANVYSGIRGIATNARDFADRADALLAALAVTAPEVEG